MDLRRRAKDRFTSYRHPALTSSGPHMLRTECQTLDEALKCIHSASKFRSSNWHRRDKQIEGELRPIPKTPVTLPRLKWMERDHDRL